MAIVNTAKKTSIGFGNPQYYAIATTVAATASQTVTLTAALPAGAAGATIGRWRVKIAPLTTATTVSSITVTGTNGAVAAENVSLVPALPGTGVSTNQIQDFITDLSPGYTQLTAVVVFGAAATGTVDFEWYGNP
jgi:hypothetical protein